MWGIFGMPLKRAIWNTLGLHAVLTTCMRFSSVSDGACVAVCLFLSTGSHVRIHIHASCCCITGCPTKTSSAQNSALRWGRVGACYSSDVPRQSKKTTYFVPYCGAC